MNLDELEAARARADAEVFIEMEAQYPNAQGTAGAKVVNICRALLSRRPQPERDARRRHPRPEGEHMSDDLVERLARAIDPASWDATPAKWGMRTVRREASIVAARACLAELSAAGYAVVPVEPTEAILRAGHDADREQFRGHTPMIGIWRAMLAASRKG